MLHGEIKINDQVIGEWTATNVGTRHGFAVYACTLTYQGLDGYSYHAEWNVWGQARRNGAVSLAARVLQEGMSHAKRVYPELKE